MQGEGARALARGAVLPVSVFVGTLIAHFAYVAFVEGGSAGQGLWALPSDLPRPGPWERYWIGHSYFLGYSYGLSLAFAAWSLRRFFAHRKAVDGAAAAGGVTVAGLLPFAVCFLVGCCGSPMLVVWLNLFGASVLPFTRPLVAGIATVSVSATWIWIAVRGRRAAAGGGCGPGCGPSCSPAASAGARQPEAGPVEASELR